MKFNGKTMGAVAHFASSEHIAFVEYGKTSYAEVMDLYKSGKYMYCILGNFMYPFVQISTSGNFMFRLPTGDGLARTLNLTAGNKWSQQFPTELKLHAETHAQGGSDPITPAMLGAVSHDEFVKFRDWVEGKLGGDAD